MTMMMIMTLTTMTVIMVDGWMKYGGWVWPGVAGVLVRLADRVRLGGVCR